VAIAMLCACAAGVARAQEAAAPAQESLETIPVKELSPEKEKAQAKDDKEPTQLESVTVTATKRAKSLRDVPASIDSFDGAKLEAQGKMSLQDYLEEKPGVALNTISPGLIRIVVRGISTDVNPVTPLPSSTGIFIGDAAFTDAYISNIQPDLSAFDLQSVELLKGPQGTLFGGAALAGAVRYILQEPVMGEWQARGFGQYVAPTGGSTAWTEGVALNAPLWSDSLALRLGYVRRNYPGVTDIVRNPRQDNVDVGRGNQYRGILSWKPWDRFSAKLTHLQQDYDTPMAATTADTRERRENNKRVLPQPTNNDFSLDSLDLNYEFEAMKVVSLTSYNKKNWYLDADATSALYGTPPDNFPAQQLGVFEIVQDDSKSWAQELRLQSTGDGPFQWLVGGYYWDYKLYFLIFIDTLAHQQALGNDSLVGSVLAGLPIALPAPLSNPGNATSILYAVSNVRASERALFFDLSQKLWNHLELSAGARLYRTNVHGGFFGTGALALAANNGQEVHYEDNDITESGISPKVTATLHFTRNHSTYVQVARGFRFGGLQSVPSSPGNNVPPIYKSDKIWNYELGLRTSWLHNTLHADAAAFYIDYQNPQIQQTTTGVPLNYISNVGHAVSRGLETELRWLTPLRGITLALAGGLTDAHTTVPFTAADGTEVPAGHKMPGAVASQYSGGIIYAAPQIGILNLGASVDYNHLGKGYSDIQNNYAINDYGTINAGISLGTFAWRLRPLLSFNVSNILDTTAAKYGQLSKPVLNPPVPGFETTYDTYLLNPPRTFTVRLSLEF
jgi:outer membrane receptor protein involved in Fe transport